jgi:uncharacterized protein
MRADGPANESGAGGFSRRTEKFTTVLRRSPGTCHSKRVTDPTDLSAEKRPGALGVGLFAKRPLAGQVKTRLAPVIGLEAAAAFAQALLDDGVARLSQGAGEAFELVFAPAQAADWFAARYPGVARRAQVGAGLAERLETWFATVLESGRPWAAVGSDSPWTSRARVAEAEALLEHGADIVLGPDHGGGYYLIAMRTPHPGLFTDIQMSTRSMFDETLAWCAARGLEVALLERDYDVDEGADWKRLCADLKAGRAGAGQRSIAAFVEALEQR